MGKIILNNIEYGTGTPNSSNVDTTNLVKKDNIVTVIDENVTDEQIPSAKAVHTVIQNVNVSVPVNTYTKEEVNNLLDTKVDTDDLVDSYSKEEVNNLLDSKADSTDIIDAYDKTEVDNLLANKADSSAIIDSYSKTEVNDLLDSKADSSSIIDAYNKEEVDDLLADKVNVDDLVDSYSKDEIDGLLADKADSTDIVDAYSKTETDGLLADKANVDDIVDAYSKTETDGLLATKADSSALDGKVNKNDVNKIITTNIEEGSIKEYILANCTEGKVYGIISKPNCTDAPKSNTTFYIIVEKVGGYTHKVTAKELTGDNEYTCIYRSDINTWSDWKKVLITEDITTTISNSSTDTQVPSAKAVYNELDTLNGKVTTNTTNIATNTTRIYGIPKRNILINGEFQVNKHKTSIPEGNITTRYVIDRWATNKSGLWISANRITTSSEQKQINSEFSLNVQVMEGCTGISIYQIIENAKILYIGKTLTMSFWVKGKRAEGKTITGRIGSSGSNTGETTVTLTDSWQYVTTTRKNCLFGGRDAGGVVILSNDTFDDYSGFEIACVKLELGDTATPFEHIPYAEELLMCQKYHMKIDGVNSNSELGLGHFSAISGTTVYPIVYLPTPIRTEPNKAITPTITATVSGLELYGCNSARTAYEVRPVTDLSIYAIKDNLVTFKCETDGEFALGTSGDFRIKRNGSQYSIELDAELY